MVFESTFFKWYLIDYSKPIIKDYWLSGRFDYEDITEIFDRRKAVRFLRYEFLFSQELTFRIKIYNIYFLWYICLESFRRGLQYINLR